MKTRFLFTLLLMMAYVANISAQATDINTIANAIYIQQAKAKPGTQVKLSVCLKNQSISVRGYQFDLYLPDGITFVQDEDGYYEANMSTTRATEKQMNYFDSDLQRDGSLRVLCSSTKGAVLSGDDGEVCTILVEVDPDAAAQDYLLQVRNAVVTDPDAIRYQLEDVTSIINVNDCNCGPKGDMNNDGVVDISDALYIIDMVLGRVPQ